MSYGRDFVLTLFSNDLELVSRADAAGIDRIGLDLERIGKEQRQGHLKTWISNHEANQLPALRAVVRQARLFVRTNPVHSGLRDEIERLLDDGAEVLMLPMFTTVREVDTFAKLIAGRAHVSLLLETAAAAARIEDIVKVEAIDEIHIGLNDLHLSMGLASHFEVLTSGIMDYLAEVVLSAGIPLGFGGIGRAGDTGLPISPDLVYAQYPRLGADRALVSRVFHSPDYTTLDLTHEVALFRHRMDEWHQMSAEALTGARQDLRKCVKEMLYDR